MCGFGYEWWMSKAAIGFLFRVQYFSGTIVAKEAPFPSQTASVAVPALLLTLTF